MAPNDSPTTFRTCTSCRAEIPYGATYFVCNVSTCNRPRVGLFFCSVSCWDGHLPEARHREAWAEERIAPTREAAMREASGNEPSAQPRRVVVAPAGSTPRAATSPATASASASASASDLPIDVLIVVSKLKAYVKARSGMNTSDGVVDVLSDELRKLCDAAIKVAAADGRKTVMDRDFRVVVDTRWGD